MKKLLSYLVAFALIVSLVVPSVTVISNATGEVTEEVTNFTDFKAALADETIDTIVIKESITATEAIKINRDVNISGTINFDGVDGNAMTVGKDVNVALNNVTLSNNSGKHVLHVWGGNLTATNLEVNHGATNGAPIVVNNGAKATFTGLTMELNDSSWYGVNVDNATATFSDVKTNGTKGTQSVICEEKNGTVNGSNLTVVKTADGQTAYVEDANLPAFVSQKTAGDKDVESITLQKDVSLTAPLFLGEEMTVNGNGYTFLGTADIGKENVVTVTADKVTLDNVGIKTAAANKSALHIYMVDTTLKNVKLDNRETVGGAGLVVNSGTVKVEGTLDIKVGANSWGGINVDAKYDNANITFADGAKVNFASTKPGLEVVYGEKSEGFESTITNAEGVGLVKNENGNYVVADKDEPSTDNPSTDKPSTDKPATDDKKTESPKTGDNTMVMGYAIIMLAALGIGGTLAVNKRKN